MIQHFVEIYTSEGFAWGALLGLGISIAVDMFIAHFKDSDTIR